LRPVSVFGVLEVVAVVVHSWMKYEGMFSPVRIGGRRS